jgi:hypothetical protein
LERQVNTSNPRLPSSHDLSDKIVAPFVTYIVSGLRRSRGDIEELCPESRIVGGLAALGEEAEQSRPAAIQWLTEIGLG